MRHQVRHAQLDTGIVLLSKLVKTVYIAAARETGYEKSQQNIYGLLVYSDHSIIFNSNTKTK